MARRKYQHAIYAADFETTADEADCRVWAYAICDVYEPESVRYGTSMDEFIYELDRLAPCKMYFHNLAFDVVFIFDYILNAGMEWVDERTPGPGQFTTLISDSNEVYSLDLCLPGGVGNR